MSYNFTVSTFLKDTLKRILITGVAGFVGSNLADTLLAKDYRVIGIDDFNSHYDPVIKRNNISGALKSPLFSLYEVDINDYQSICRIFKKEKPETIIHIAGLTGMLNSIDSPDKFFHTNVHGTESVLEACRKLKVGQFIFASTSSVYGNITDKADENTPLPQPLNPYVLSKIMAEEVVASYARHHGLNATILRLSTVFGPRQKRTQAISKFTHQIAHHEKVTVYGNGQAVRNYLYVEDCVRAFIFTLSKPFYFEIFNIGTQSVISVTRSLKLISDLLGVTPEIEYIDHPEIVPKTSNIGVSKAGKMLNFHPEIPFERGIEYYIKWYLSSK
jgi:UDP-glucuronate 4-epimerase